MKTYGRVDVQIHVFLTSALVGGDWPASCPGRFILEERVPGTPWIGDWVDPRTGLDNVENILDPTSSGNSDPSVANIVLIFR
jgi:hypothetical protein